MTLDRAIQGSGGMKTLKSVARQAKVACHWQLSKGLKAHSQTNLDHHASRRSFSSILLFSAAMAQISTPKTALATTSATEYPICSPAVAATPEMPNILMMYTKG